MPPPSYRRVVSVLACLLALAGCGDADDEDQEAFSVTFSKGTVRIRCGGGDCAIGVIRDSGLFFVGGTRTVDGVPEERRLELPSLTNVDIVTGSGTDSVLFLDAHVPGTIQIATGAGDDRIDLCDSNAGAVTGIDLGAGDDDFMLGSGGYSTRFRLYTGPGDDGGYLEGLSGAEGDDILVDGGDGDDVIDIGTTNPPDGFALVNFERNPQGMPLALPWD